MIKFGPAGIGSAKNSPIILEQYHKLGIKAAEIPFTYQIWIKPSECPIIREAAEKFEIKLSIHAPYWINLNSAEKQKIEQSKKRILDCCKIGELLGAKIVVFHAGFYGKDTKEKTYETIKKSVLEILKEIKNNNWKIKIAPETMGKINIFGSVEEILKLSKETGCSFCVDFAHLWARNQGKISYKELYKDFSDFNALHCHFSGIEFTEKGEKNHKLTEEKEIKNLLNALPKDKDITLINESPNPLEDTIKSINIFKNLNHA